MPPFVDVYAVVTEVQVLVHGPQEQLAAKRVQRRQDQEQISAAAVRDDLALRRMKDRIRQPVAPFARVPEVGLAQRPYQMRIGVRQVGHGNPGIPHPFDECQRSDGPLGDHAGIFTTVQQVLAVAFQPVFRHVQGDDDAGVVEKPAKLFIGFQRPFRPVRHKCQQTRDIFIKIPVPADGVDERVIVAVAPRINLPYERIFSARRQVKHIITERQSCVPSHERQMVPVEIILGNDAD